MNWLDMAILGIILVSSLVSLFRGFVREALSLAFWVVAFWVGINYYAKLAVPLAQWIKEPSMQKAAAFVILFLVVLILGGLITFLVAKLIDATGLSGMDRIIGMLFGATRGALLVAGLVLLAGLTPLPQDSWWQQSQLVGHFEGLATWLRGLLPPDFADWIRLGGEGAAALAPAGQPVDPNTLPLPLPPAGTR